MNVSTLFKGPSLELYSVEYWEIPRYPPTAMAEHCLASCLSAVHLCIDLSTRLKVVALCFPHFPPYMFG